MALSKNVEKKAGPALKGIVRQRILEDVIQDEQRPNKDRVEWRVLVMDSKATKIVSSCLKMHELQGIAIPQGIENRREPLPSMEAIYLMSPTEENIGRLIEDFSKPTDKAYKGAHVYFIEACPDHLLNELAESRAATFIFTFKEINLAVLPIEDQAFTNPLWSSLGPFFNPNHQDHKFFNMAAKAEDLATICSALDEYPSIRYRSGCARTKEFAQHVQQKLEDYKTIQPSFGQSHPVKARSQLIILDRGFDAVTPLLHELTYQAMVYDVLNEYDSDGNVYRYENDEGQEEKVVLDESDNLWVTIRHKHIVEARESVKNQVVELIAFRNKASGDASNYDTKALSELIKKVPHHHKKVSEFQAHESIVKTLFEMYNEYVEKLCKVEQDLAMGSNDEGKLLQAQDHIGRIYPIVGDANVKTEDKIRLILLYILATNGIKETSLDKLFQHAQIPGDEIDKWRKTVENLSHHGFNSIEDGRAKMQPWKMQPVFKEGVYQTSRWTPVLKSIVEDATKDKLDQKNFPYLKMVRKGNAGAVSARPTKSKEGGDVPRIIVYVIGGATYSETRAGYEVTQETNCAWDVFVGGSQVLTPEKFLHDLSVLG